MSCEFCGVAFTAQVGTQGPRRAARQRFCSRRCAIHSRGRRAEFCAVEGCTNPDQTRGLCGGHAHRLKVWGDVRADLPLRKRAPRGQVRHSHGYLVVGGRAGHPNANRDGTIRVHRLVMSEVLGRPLLPGENVHHINGDKLDNRPENLELWITAHPAGQRTADVVDHAVEMLRRYAPERLDREYGERSAAA